MFEGYLKTLESLRVVVIPLLLLLGMVDSRKAGHGAAIAHIVGGVEVLGNDLLEAIVCQYQIGRLTKTQPLTI